MRCIWVKAATAAHHELRRQIALRTKATADVDLATELIRSRAFSGDLTAGWRAAHSERLREEQVAQAEALREAGWESC